MAVGAGCPLARVMAGINWEPGMVECCASPGCSVVASLAGCGKRRGHVVRTGRSRVLRFVTGQAIRGRARVASANVTVGTCNCRMCSSQWKHCLAVIENRRYPRQCVVADLAVSGKTAGHVVRVCGLLEVRLVTCDACGAEANKNPAGVRYRSKEYALP